jgi:hypothetical protein
MDTFYKGFLRIFLRIGCVPGEARFLIPAMLIEFPVEHRVNVPLPLKRRQILSLRLPHLIKQCADLSR